MKHSQSEHEDEIFARLSRRIRSAQSRPSHSGALDPYLMTRTEDFWDRHLGDLVNDALGLGLARADGLEPFGKLLGKAFGTTRYLSAGYVQLAGHVNNMALGPWMPESSRTSPKVQALAQLHARSLILIEEIFTLSLMGYPSGAASLARTLHEVRVVAAFLHRFEARLSERYLASHIVDLWKTRADFAPVGSAKRSKRWLATEREMEDRYQAVIRRHGESMAIENGWALPRFIKRGEPGRPLPKRVPFARLEQEVRKPFDRVIYRQGSQHIHASHLGGIKTLRSGVGNEVLLGPRPFDLDRAALNAMWDVQDITNSLLRSCGHFTGKTEIYYWLEALDQLSFVVRGSMSDGQDMLDEFWAGRKASRPPGLHTGHETQTPRSSVRTRNSPE